MTTFDLKNAHNLRAKMQRDLQKWKAAPLDSDCAFNFFVTAEHMLDWIHPKSASTRTNIKKGEILLRICSHLANGLKHFEVDDSRHDTVASSGVAGGYMPPALFNRAMFPDAMFGAGRRLVVTLKGDAAAKFGPVIGAIELADKIMAYWDNHPLK